MLASRQAKYVLSVRELETVTKTRMNSGEARRIKRVHSGVG